MSRFVWFVVPGPVRGQGRPRFLRAGRAYKAAADRAWEARIRDAWAEAADGMPPLPRDVPVDVTVTVRRPVPKGSRAVWEQDVHRPDVDNILKSVLDALNGVAWADDAQVTRATVVKCPRKRMPDWPEGCMAVGVEW